VVSLNEAGMSKL